MTSVTPVWREIPEVQISPSVQPETCGGIRRPRFQRAHLARGPIPGAEGATLFPAGSAQHGNYRLNFVEDDEWYNCSAFDLVQQTTRKCHRRPLLGCVEIFLLLLSFMCLF